MMQYKLYKIYNEDRDKTIESLNNIFGKENLWFLTERVVGIKYDYNQNDYKELLKKTMNLNMRQIILTANVFVDFLELCIDRKYFISELSFLDSISLEDKEYIDNQLNVVKNGTDKKVIEKAKQILFRELKWLSVEGCIDIKNIDIIIDYDDRNGYVQLYNNGVILLNRQELTGVLEEMFLHVIK